MKSCQLHRLFYGKIPMLLPLFLITLLLSFAQLGKAGAPSATETKAGHPANLTKVTAATPGAKPQVAVMQPAAPSSHAPLSALFVTAGIVVIGMLLVKKFGRGVMNLLTRRMEPWSFAPVDAPEAWPKTVAEEEDFTKFLVGFHAGPASPRKTEAAAVAPSPRIPAAENLSRSKPQTPALKEFFGWVPEHLVALRNLLQRTNRVSGQTDAREKLAALAVQVLALKTRSALPELLPAWQMASALEGLLKQLTDRPDNINASTLRTVAQGIDLLAQLCVPELRADLATNPPIQVLVVDDDPISRMVLTSTVKKAFDAPALAENGTIALSLADRQAYDLVFMDVNMPGMNGFEACSKIHDTALNRSTPVVFVTCMKDFDSRTASVASGGSDLIGKPFLGFEIIVKAFTLVLGERLKARELIVEASNLTVIEIPVQPVPAAPAPAQSDAPAPIMAAAQPPSPGEIREQLQQIGQSLDEPARREMLGKLYVRIQSLTRTIDTPELRPAFQLCSALESLLKKLSENPKNATASTLLTATAAVDLLDDLCAAGVAPDLATKPAINIMVVDDEPLSRRAVVSSLQAAALQPDSVENVKDALALAAEKRFDVIFLDVQMPGMDGFAVCTKIHESVPNRTTPVVFVTSHNDLKSRAQSALYGGSDFVVKPFLFVEITVKALTFALRGRLPKKG
jgi:CheY-like chemotaxis protein